MTKPLSLWARFRRHKGAVAGIALLGLITLAVVIGPWLWTIDPCSIDMSARNLPPSLTHLFGTDQLGRDMLARVMAGGRISLAVGLAAMSLSLLLGTLIGLLAGMMRGLDALLMRLTDLFLSLPLLPLLLVMVMLFRAPLAAALGPATGLFVLITAAIALTSWMQTARLVRAEVLRLRGVDFVLAARGIGFSESRVTAFHILPNVLSPVLVSAALGIANAILTESALSFLGLGFPPDTPSWGRLLKDGIVYMADSPARVIFPGLAISLTVLAVTHVGDGLRDALDPRHQRR